jgi:hypothetical protein
MIKESAILPPRPAVFFGNESGLGDRRWDGGPLSSIYFRDMDVTEEPISDPPPIFFVSLVQSYLDKKTDM